MDSAKRQPRGSQLKMMSFKAPVDLIELAREAATAEDRTLSSFVVAAMRERAQRILGARDTAR